MQIFYDAQGQLINSLRLVLLKDQTHPGFWLSLLPERMKTVQSKVSALEWSQYYPSVFKMFKGS